MSFSIDRIDGNNFASTAGRYLYETIMIHWLRACLNAAESPPSCDSSSRKCIQDYQVHTDFILPLCLKSMSLHYDYEASRTHLPHAPAFLDEHHMQVLCLFVGMLARGLIGQALLESGSEEAVNRALIHVLCQSQVVHDFLIGLSGILHPEHMDMLLKQYVSALRSGETDTLSSDRGFVWNETSTHRAKVALHLRLRFVETFAVLPYFMALNFPPKYAPHQDQAKSSSATWMHQTIELRTHSAQLATEDERLPQAGWLADLLVSEALSICALSSETVVAEALTMTHENGESSRQASSLKRSGEALTRKGLLMFQSISIHAITCVYELIVRRHSMDKRYQSELCHERVAGVIASQILERSVVAVKWLARMDSAHRIRVLWMLSFIYSLQEAPESYIGSVVRRLCSPSNFSIHRFIRLLRLCSATFECLINVSVHENLYQQFGQDVTNWLVQESFNTICATTITVVDECANLAVALSEEQERITAGILDLLLHILTMPQSPVTQLRAVGGVLQVLERFGVELFLEVTGQDLQHWMRVIISLMNSTSLSVRSISIDFVVSLIGSTYEYSGCVDELTLVFATLLPEVAAREISLFSVAGLLLGSDDLAKCLWPLRRSIADLEDADDRIDPQLVPILTVFCRACQAVIDGVLIELRLRGEHTTIIGTQISASVDYSFDADEESLLEAACFFSPETAPMQRIRWLSTLNSLHQSKHQWVEAGETLLLCAATINAALPFLKHVWRPLRYDHWSDISKSAWLDSVGEELAHPDRGNVQVMEFAHEFLEPITLLGVSPTTSIPGKLQQPTVQSMSSLLVRLLRDATTSYNRHEGMTEHVLTRLDVLLQSVAAALKGPHSGVKDGRSMSAMARRRRLEDESALRKTIIGITTEMTKLTEMGQSGELSESSVTDHTCVLHTENNEKPLPQIRSAYAVIRLSGKKPARFSESTGIPVFLDFDVPHVCRLPVTVANLSQFTNDPMLTSHADLFAKRFISALHKVCPQESVALYMEPWNDSVETDNKKTHVHVFPVEAVETETSGGLLPLYSKVFFYRKQVGMMLEQPSVIEMRVAKPLPGPLSRQRVLVTTEIIATQVRY
jgi:hypothetical protein